MTQAIFVRSLSINQIRTHREKHKAGGAALGLSCAACLELSAGVFADSAAVLTPP